ncbi:glycerate kinase [Bacillus sp. EB106-08-02-XG196]|jgi:glycerate 2-kinase|uniref:glycerate kinase n=1 Tax=Bacillus sp. EB106-08-02-XG196 TaxID=2737049 RepID=UPI0015C46CCE|nr:glycerate kinase [Bacillus sp. EB106-08-02-XG196]NWQ39545.1 glycerate kinase [Bacillus sp. EB106-08-02-XG196]
MKVVIAPDSFKESLSALEVANAVEEGFREVFPDAEYVKLPMADGGEGLVHSLVNAMEGQVVNHTVTGPLGEKVEGFFGLIHDGKTAVIEMAAASGLHLLSPEKRNPLQTTTFGVGELLLAALEYNVETIILGLGGSSTNDGGAGMVQALGGRLFDVNGCDIGFGGGALADLHSINLEGFEVRLNEIRFEVACDVENPLLGETGASAVFGPQKGATPEMVSVLDHNLCHFARIIERDLSKDVSEIPGAGAAGGLGAGLLAFLPCQLRKGIQIVMEATGLDDHIQDASLVITGEGKIDSQTIYGKTPIGVAAAAQKHNVHVIALAGTLGEGYEAVYQHGINTVFSIVPGISTLEEALKNAQQNIVSTSRNIASLLNAVPNAVPVTTRGQCTPQADSSIH